MTSTTIFIIRHRETDWNTIGKIQGHIDIPLNDKGKEQARRAASFLKNKKVEPVAFYSSDLQRAHQTAQPISEVFALDIVTMPQLRERHMGVLEGLTKQDVYQKYEKHCDDDYFDTVLDGESKVDFLKRLTGQISFIAQNHKNESIIIVTHGHLMRQFIDYAEYDRDAWASINNTSIITINYHHADEPRIELISIKCAEK